MIEWDVRQRKLRTRFARCHTLLNAVRWDEGAADQFCWEKWELIRQSGILQLPFEEKYGGLGEDLLTTMYVLEGLGYGCRDGGLAFSVCSHIVSAGVPLQRFGTDEFKERYMHRLCNGSSIGAHAITEPQGGSDVLAMKANAVKQGSHYILTGSKAFVTNAPVADVFVVYVRTSHRGGPLGTTAFIIDRDTPGLHTSVPMRKMGLTGSPMGELVLDGCKVNGANMIGKQGSGFLVLDFVMKWEILCTFTVAVGAMQHRLEQCIEYARTCHQSKRPIGSSQLIAHKIVDMKIATETARRWLHNTACRFANDHDTTTDLAITKLVVSEASVATARTALEVFGTNAYTTSSGLEADLQDAVAGTIYSGTSEIQRNKIARMLGLQNYSRASQGVTV